VDTALGTYSSGSWTHPAGTRSYTNSIAPVTVRSQYTIHVNYNGNGVYGAGGFTDGETLGLTVTFKLMP
jgi:hypothetical protein